jgi:glyoxylase-like metal-dependent hydrolase (beta-lactamase superfamily II)
MVSQISEVDAPEEGVYQIYQLTYARDHHRRVHNNFMLLDMHDGPMPVDFNVWILRNSERVVLVDTGFGPRASSLRGRPLEIDPVEALATIGIPSASVEDIILTHLHFDHAGSIERFEKARFHIQDQEMSFATGRCMCDHFVRRPFDVEDIVTLVRRNYEARVVFHDGDEEIFPGISVHKFPGHSAGLQSVRVMTARGPVILASDASHYWANILTMRPFNLTVDVTATLATYRKLMAMGGTPDRIIPGHDPKVRRLFPSLDVNGIELLALHAEPKPYDLSDLTRTDHC